MSVCGKKAFVLLILLCICLCSLSSPKANAAGTLYFEQDEDVDKMIVNIKKAVDANEWKTAVFILNKLIKMPSKMAMVYRVNEDYYITLGEYIAEMVSAWPDEARSGLAESLKDEIDARYKNAKNIADWENIARTYPFCAEGLKAHFHIATAHFENSDLGRTLYWLERAKRLFKMTPEKYPQFFTIMACCYAGTGNIPGSESIADELKKLGNIKVQSENREWDVASLVTQIKGFIEMGKRGGFAGQEKEAGDYLVPKNIIANFEARAYYWNDKLIDIYGQTKELPMIEQNATIIGNKLIVPSGKSIRTYDLGTKKMVWSFGDLNEKQANVGAMGRQIMYNGGRPGSPQGTMDVLRIGDRLIVNNGFVAGAAKRTAMLKPNAKAMVAPSPVKPNTVLSALGLDGQEIWNASAANKEDNLFLSESVFFNLPAEKSGKLYAVILPVTPYQQLFLACFDSDTGVMEWKKFIVAFDPDKGDAQMGRANVFQWFLARMGPQKGEKNPPMIGDDAAPIVDDLCIYISSRLDFIGAFDKTNGNPLWIFQYPFKPTISRIGFRNINDGWMVNKSILWRHLLIAAPSNAENLYALNKMNGAKAWTYPRGSHNFLLGVYNSKVILTGKKVTALDAQTGKELWSKDLGSQPFGRGTLYKGVIYHPTEKGLFLLDADSGNVLHTLNWNEPFKNGGNVVITGGKIVICGYNNVIVYDTATAEKK